LLPTSSATAKASVVGSFLRVPEEEGETSEVVEEAAHVESVLLLLVERLRLFGVRAREYPVSAALGDDRRLEVPVSESFTVAEPLRKLERRLDVGTSRLPVALAPVAAGPPAEDPAAQPVVDRLGTAHQLERLGEERDRGRDRRQPVAALSDVAEDVGAIDVRERVVVNEIVCLCERSQRILDPTDLGARRRGGEERPQIEVRFEDRIVVRESIENRDRVVELPRPNRSFRARDHARNPFVLRGGDAGLEEAPRDLEPLGEPLESCLVRPHAAPLDLADVLLREAVDPELALRQPARDAQLPDALSERRRRRRVRRPGPGLRRDP
jgi:hypothetical protein